MSSSVVYTNLDGQHLYLEPKIYKKKYGNYLGLVISIHIIDIRNYDYPEIS